MIIAGIIILFLNMESILAQDLKPCQRSGRWGYCDQEDYLAIEAKYDSAFEFIDETAIIRINGNLGLIDDNGDEILPSFYRNIYRYKNASDLFMLHRENRYCIFDLSKRSIISYYFSLEKNAIDCLIVKNHIIKPLNSVLKIKLFKKQGLIQISGKEILPVRYDSIISPENMNCYILKKDSFYGFSDLKGNLLNNFDKKKYLGTWGTRAVFWKYEQWIFCDEKSVEYPEIQSLKDTVKVFKQNAHYGLLNQKGKQILNFDYDSILCQKGFWVYWKNNKAGLAYIHGEIIFDPVSEQNREVNIESIDLIINNKKATFIPKTGELTWSDSEMKKN